MVWMRVAAFPSFHKLSRQVLDRGLRAGEVLNVTVRPRFDVAPFDGQKAVVIANTNAVGGKNAFF
jgi:hypothetical protein